MMGGSSGDGALGIMEQPKTQRRSKVEWEDATVKNFGENAACGVA